MKILSKFKHFSYKTIAASIIVAVAAIGIFTFIPNLAQAASDCDNAVVWCGVSSVGELQNKYQNGVSGHNTASSIQHIYSYFGISASDIRNMNSVSGEVYSDGTVKVNGKVVATNAMTAGRLNASSSCGGSTERNVGGTKFWTRKPCVSFKSSPLSALVVMKNNVFQFAILTSCGNPVTGTPKQPTPPPHHNACVNKACVQVNGAGSNTCTSNANCQPQHHYACVSNACKQVTGAGANTCTSNANCQPAQHHYTCINNACVQVNGAGSNTCTSNANCQQVQHHYTCVNYACVQVSGAGYNSCTSNADCQPAPTVCTPTPTPYSNW